jgi:hypothetical protein
MPAIEHIPAPSIAAKGSRNQLGVAQRFRGRQQRRLLVEDSHRGKDTQADMNGSPEGRFFHSGLGTTRFPLEGHIRRECQNCDAQWKCWAIIACQ